MQPMTAFERWFAEVAIYSMANDLCSGAYVWNLQEPGDWLLMFNDGADPGDAAEQFFAALH